MEEICKELKRGDALPDADEVKIYVRRMEKYLSHLVHEYERKMPAFEGDPPSLPLLELPGLQDFVKPHPQSNIEEEFTHPYYDAIAVLRRGNLSSLGDGVKHQ